MKFTVKKLIAFGAVLVVLCCGIMLWAAKSAGSPTWLSAAAGAIVTPLERGASAVGTWVSDFFGYFYRYDSLKSENEEMQKQLAEYQSMENEYYSAIKENAELRKLTGIREKHADFQCEPCAVVSTISTGFQSSFTINRGSLSGIEAGDCVITDLGLVGYVSEVGVNYSTVITILNIDFQVSAINARTRETLVAQGSFEFSAQNRMKLSYLKNGADIQVGDTIVTSGSTKYPPNLTIGTVTDFAVEEHGICSYATIQPAVDFDKLTNVFVVKEFEVVD